MFGSIIDIACLVSGVRAERKGPEVPHQLNRGAGMCSGHWLDETLIGGGEGGRGEMKEFALWRGCLCQGQRCSLQYAQLTGS